MATRPTIKIKTINTSSTGGRTYSNTPGTTIEDATLLHPLETGELGYNAWNNGLYIGYNGKNYLLSVTNENGPKAYEELSGTHFYGAADKADKLTAGDAGNATTPVYFLNGIPKAANAYSTLLTAVSSTAAKPLSVTVGGTTKTSDNLYATHVKADSSDSKAGKILFSTGTNTTPFMDAAIYTTAQAGQMVIPYSINREVKISPATTLENVAVQGSVSLQYNEAKKSLDFIFA